MSKRDKQHLPTAVGALFELVDWAGGHKKYFGGKWGTVDLKTITVRQAKRLVGMGFPYLRKRPEPARKEKVKVDE